MAGMFCGHSDPPLNDRGRVQIERAASMLLGVPEVVYTSDLLRARESAEILAAHFSVPLLVRPGLREICFGDWEGLSWHEVERRFPAESSTWVRGFPAGAAPTGEPYEAFIARVKSEMEFLRAQAQLQAWVAVTHGGFIRSALIELYGLTSEEAFVLRPSMLRSSTSRVYLWEWHETRGPDPRAHRISDFLRDDLLVPARQKIIRITFSRGFRAIMPGKMEGADYEHCNYAR